MPEIKFKIKKDGTVESEGKGFKGKKCDEVMGQFEKALGNVKERKNSNEYYEDEVNITPGQYVPLKYGNN